MVHENKPATRDQWKGKINFVEIRSFWHLFRSFDRMWSFFILCLQVILKLLNISVRVRACMCVILTLFVLRVCLILTLFVLQKAMIIIAWNGTGSPSGIFDGVIFKKVLSVFITAAILKLGQCELELFQLV